MLIHDFPVLVGHVHRSFDHWKIQVFNQVGVKNLVSVNFVQEQNEEFRELLLAKLLIKRKKFSFFLQMVFWSRIVNFNRDKLAHLIAE